MSNFVHFFILLLNTLYYWCKGWGSNSQGQMTLVLQTRTLPLTCYLYIGWGSGARTHTVYRQRVVAYSNLHIPQYLWCRLWVTIPASLNTGFTDQLPSLEIYDDIFCSYLLDSNQSKTHQWSLHYRYTKTCLIIDKNLFYLKFS